MNRFFQNHGVTRHCRAPDYTAVSFNMMYTIGLASLAMTAASTKENILSAFRCTGLSPLNVHIFDTELTKIEAAHQPTKVHVQDDADAVINENDDDDVNENDYENGENESNQEKLNPPHELSSSTSSSSASSSPKPLACSIGETANTIMQSLPQVKTNDLLKNFLGCVQRNDFNGLLLIATGSARIIDKYVCITRGLLTVIDETMRSYLNLLHVIVLTDSQQKAEAGAREKTREE